MFRIIKVFFMILYFFLFEGRFGVTEKVLDKRSRVFEIVLDDLKIISYNNKMTSTQTTNFNQPQSLVKYSNPVLVSSSGKKQIKVNPILNSGPESQQRQLLHWGYSKLHPAAEIVHNREATTVVFIY